MNESFFKQNKLDFQPEFVNSQQCKENLASCSRPETTAKFSQNTNKDEIQNV